MLENLNRRSTAFAGLIGAAALAAKVVFDPRFLLALYHAIVDLRARAATDADLYTLAQTFAAVLGIGTLLYIGAPWFVRDQEPPATVSPKPPGTARES